MQWLGPYVINELNTSEVVQFKTVNGKPKANYINGSHLKKYEEPLTEEMLHQIHAAKNHKQGLA